MACMHEAGNTVVFGPISCLYAWLFFRNSTDNVQAEVDQRFPTISSRRMQAAPYIPRHTYTLPARPSRSVPQRRASNVVGVSKTFTRDVVLLTKSDDGTIPRGARRAVLYDKGRIANMVDFQASWDEVAMRTRVEECFSGVLDLNKPYPRYVHLSLCT